MMLRRALCILFLLCSAGAFGSEAEEAQPVYDFHAHSGLGYSLFIPGGYEQVSGGEYGSLDFNTSITVSDNIPIFSEFRFSTSLTGSANYNEKPARLSSSNSGNSSFFLELKSPFTKDFLSYNARWYLQFGMSSTRHEAKANEDIFYQDGSLFSKGDQLNLGENIWRVAIAVNTPYTLLDRAESRSRFGVFYQESERARSVDIEDVHYMLGMTERTIGGFYDFKKPIFRPELVLEINVALGLSYAEISSNSFGYSNADFDNIRLMLYTEAGLGLDYRIAFTENSGLKFGADYKYRAYTPFNQSGDKEFDTGGDHRVSANIAFSYIR
jgi:hypothetical protein